MRKLDNKYLLISILPIIILISISIKPILTNSIGEEIIIKGQVHNNLGSDSNYVEYDINSIELDKVPKDLFNFINTEDDDNGYVDMNDYYRKTIYVILKKQNDYYEVDYTTFEKPRDNKIYLEAKPRYAGFDDDKKISYLGVVYTLDEHINRKKVSEDILTKFKNDKNFYPVDAKLKIKIYNGYGLLEEAY